MPHTGAIIYSLRKYFLQYLLFIGIVYLPFSLLSQPRTLASLDTFSIEKDSGEVYALAINNARKHILNSKVLDSFELLNLHIEELVNYEYSDTSLIRKVIGYHGHYYEKMLNDQKWSEKYYQLAFQTGSFESDYAMSSYIASRLGVFFNQNGDLERSSYFTQLAASGYMQLEDFGRASGKYMNLAIAYQEKDSASSYKYYEQAIGIAKEQNLPYREYFAKGNLCDFFLTYGDTTSFLKNLEDMRKGISGIENKVEYHEINQMLLGHEAVEARRNGDFDGVLNYLKSIFHSMDVEYEHRFRREYAKLCNDIALNYLEINEYDSVKTYIKQGFYYLTRMDTSLLLPNELMYQENTFLELYTTLSDLYKNLFLNYGTRSYADSALLCIEKGIYINDTLYNDVLMEDSKLLSVESLRSLVEREVELYSLMNEGGEAVPIQKIKETFDRSKGIYLQELNDRKLAFEKLPVLQKEQYTSNLELLGDLRRENAKLTLKNQEKIISLQNENKDLLNPYLSRTSGQSNQDFVDFLVTDKFVFALDDFEGEYRFTKLGPTTHLIDQLNQFWSLNNPRARKEDLSAILQSLYITLLAPLAPLPKNFQVYPDDVISQIPFDALMPSPSKYLVSKHNVSIAIGINRGDISNESLRRIICSAPYYGEPKENEEIERGDISGLAFTNNEVEAIKTRFDSVVEIDNINLDTLRYYASRADVLHYAGHAQSDDSKGMLIVAGDEKGIKERISGSDISSISSDFDLVVLSACESGLGRIRKGEGSLSLARAFHEGGARNVVSSLWNANDISASRIMTYFYDFIKKDQHPALALKNAKIKYLKNAIGNENHPYYWSGFVVSTTGDFSGESNKWPISYLFIALLGIVSILFIFFKTPKS